METVLQSFNNIFLTGNKSSLAFGSVTSFFGIKGAFFAFFLKNGKTDLCQIVFQSL